MPWGGGGRHFFNIESGVDLVELMMRGTPLASPWGARLWFSDWLAKLLCNPQKDAKGQRGSLSCICRFSRL